jgi:hypothetical protein
MRVTAEKETKPTYTVKMAVFWGVAPCSVADTDWNVRGVYYLHYQGDYC